MLLTAGGFAFAADVNGTAAAAGLSCTDVLAKVEIWWESVRNATREEQIQFKERVAQLVGQSCDTNGGKAPLPNKDVVPADEAKLKSPAEMSPRCLAAQSIHRPASCRADVSKLQGAGRPFDPDSLTLDFDYSGQARGD